MTSKEHELPLENGRRGGLPQGRGRLGAWWLGNELRRRRTGDWSDSIARPTMVKRRWPGLRSADRAIVGNPVQPPAFTLAVRRSIS